MYDFELSIEEIAQWPPATQLVAMIVLSALLHGVGFWFYLQPKLVELESAKLLEQQLKPQLVLKANQVAPLSRLGTQLDSLKQGYQQLAKPFTSHADLGALLATISQEGQKHALTFHRIDWGHKQPHGLFERWPIDIELSGRYHDIGDFSAALARLPQVLVVEQVRWQPMKSQPAKLTVSLRAYRYQIKVEADNEE